MLVRLAIDPEGIGMQGHDPALQSKLTDDLITAWMRYGVLYFGSADYAHSRLRHAIEGLPPALRSRWMRATGFAQQRGLMRGGPEAWAGFFPNSDLDCFLELRCENVDVTVCESSTGVASWLCAK